MDTTGFTLPEPFRVLAKEIATYYRELPRLVAEGHECKVALVRGEELTVWDTSNDAFQYAGEKYGIGPYLAQPIDGRDLDRLAPYVFPAAKRGTA
jgi:hypothetical protein